MRHISIEPPAFFHRGPTPLARLAFFGLISIALLFVDTRYHYLEGIRRVVAVALYPLQRHSRQRHPLYFALSPLLPLTAIWPALACDCSADEPAAG